MYGQIKLVFAGSQCHSIYWCYYYGEEKESLTVIWLIKKSLLSRLLLSVLGHQRWVVMMFSLPQLLCIAILISKFAPQNVSLQNEICDISTHDLPFLAINTR